MAGSIIIKPEIAATFKAVMEHGRILMFSAPCGFGKTAVAEALVAGRRVCRRDAGAPGFSLPSAGDDWDILLLDELQQLQDETEQQALCALIRDCPEQRFVLLSRGVPPGWLMAFQYTGLMQTLDARALLLDREQTKRLLQTYDLTLSESELSRLHAESIGYPLAVRITAYCMRGAKRFTPEVSAQAYHELFLYFETAVYRRFDLPVRRFLLELAPFEHFDLELARMISGDNNAGELLDRLQRTTTMMQYGGGQQLRFWPQFRQFLLWEMDREYTDDKRRALLSRAGLYYELHEDYPHALECYTEAKDHNKASELLIRSAERHPGMGFYREMEQYYRALPQSEILASPALMQSMSMLCALSADYEGSERWYRELRAFAGRCDRADAAGRQARSRLAWLDISLPQRSVRELTKLIPAAAQMLANREIALPSFSVTSTMPSIMNGGKDFSDWSKKDELLYSTMRAPVERILGTDGVGLADCALAESKFEKGEDISMQMLTLVARLGEIQRGGTADVEFANVGLLVRSQVDAGHAEDARRTALSLYERFTDPATQRFVPNLDAMLCRIALHQGDLDTAEAWYREKAPRDPLNVNILRRYQYFTQAMVELADGKPDAALLTLAPLEPFCTACARHIDGIHLNVLRAIALRRKKDAAWRESLCAALDAAREYRFIRTISVYGCAVLPLLEDCQWEKDKRWLKRLTAAVRQQAVNYPAFLQPRLGAAATLTATELQVLKLLCADKSNAEIGEIMDIKLPTVKTHVSHILTKLGVSRRSEAKTAARRLRLVE